MAAYEKLMLEYSKGLIQVRHGQSDSIIFPKTLPPGSYK